jgi:type IV secretory pathway TrbD component
MSLTAVSLLLAMVAVFGVALMLVALATATRAQVRPALLPVRARYGRRGPQR